MIPGLPAVHRFQRPVCLAFLLCATACPSLLGSNTATNAIAGLTPDSALPSTSAAHPPLSTSLPAPLDPISVPAPLSPVTNVANRPTAPAESNLSPSAASVTNGLPQEWVESLDGTNGLPPATLSPEELAVHYARRLEMARYLRTTRQPHEAEPILIHLMSDQCPEPIQQSALLELAALAQDENDSLRSLQIYAQFLNKWPNDLRVPEILLRQGLLFRQLALPNLALTKFYGVMTSALVLKNDQLDYYARLVIQAQSEIAETQYELGKYADAADFFSRLLKRDNPAIHKAEMIYKLTRCHSALNRYAEAVSDAQEFLAHFPDAPEQPEVRFYLAVALKELGRNNESLQQVLLLLQEQRTRTVQHPETWAYWQQRAGNLVANQLYREGDYIRALEIYQHLAALDSSLEWQAPVQYQIGMSFERLWQPQMAVQTYSGILNREKELGTNATPSLTTVFDMARWRIHFINWQQKAEDANRQFQPPASTNAPVTASLPAATTAIP